MKISAIFAYIYLALSSTSAFSAEAIAGDIQFNGVPDSFEDGDSFWIGIHKIRLHGIDAPEPKQTCGSITKSIDCGQKALEFLKHLSSTKEFNCRIHKGKGGKPWIMYGRYVATCYVGNQNVGLELVKAGWALASNKPYGDNYREFQSDAQKKNAGMHATGILKTPWEYRREQRSDQCPDNGNHFQSIVPAPN